MDGSEVAVARHAAQEADVPATENSELIREAEEDVKRAKAKYEDFQVEVAWGSVSVLVVSQL